MARKIANAKCPMEATLGVMGGKWKGVILYYLTNKSLRFSDLRRSIPRVTEKMLIQQLREMESDNLITRTIYNQVPPRVEYALTSYGKTLLPVIAEMCKWGTAHLNSNYGKGEDEVSA